VTILAAKIRVEKLSAWYGPKLAIEDINLELEEHAVSGIIGPSGCGKSTLIRCLNRMHETIPKARVEGKVHLDEEDIYELPAVSVRRRIGMVFQKPNPFPTMSIYDNVAAGLRRGQGLARQERRESLGWPAATPVHCARPRGQAGGRPHGRAVLRPRSDCNGED